MVVHLSTLTNLGLLGIGSAVQLLFTSHFFSNFIISMDWYSSVLIMFFFKSDGLLSYTDCSPLGDVFSTMQAQQSGASRHKNSPGSNHAPRQHSHFGLRVCGFKGSIQICSIPLPTGPTPENLICKPSWKCLSAMAALQFFEDAESSRETDLWDFQV